MQRAEQIAQAQRLLHYLENPHDRCRNSALPATG